MTAARAFRFRVSPADDGVRLDQLLAANVTGLSRRKARVLIDIGGVFVDGARTKVAGRLVHRNQEIVAHLGGALERATGEPGRAGGVPDDARLPAFVVVHQDHDICVVDKPSGLLTAPTPESDRNNLAHALRQRLQGEIFVVHRLDLETSGLLVFARNEVSNRQLAALFRAHDVEREYLAVLRGLVAADRQTVDLPVARKRAVTHLSVVKRFALVGQDAASGPATLTRCRLETGRTHQIRLHALHLGHPVLGDRRYGPPPSPPSGRPPRMALHAAILGFRHPRSGKAVRFESSMPEDLAIWLGS
jgi:23S rRNA pseudouridine1911/1915/1917 synthase